MDTKPTIELTQAEMRDHITIALNAALDSRNVSLWDNWPGTFSLAERVCQSLQDFVEYSKGTIKKGSKVRIASGFSTGSKGVVEFVEPGQHPAAKVWVTRYGDSSPKFWLKHELELLE